MNAVAPFKNLDRVHLPPATPNADAEFLKILEALATDYGAQKIIVFGSCVRGSVGRDSDVDLCVIREHPAGDSHPGLLADLAVSRRRPLLSTDILVRTPSEFAAQAERGFGVIRAVVEEGVSVYER